MELTADYRKRVQRKLTRAAMLAGLMAGCGGCGGTQKQQEAPALSYETIAGRQDAADTYDLPQIQENGELIAVTLSGPDTYYEYRGKATGMQYEMAERFATAMGTRLRMETVHDTAELLQRIAQQEADLIAVELEEKWLKEGLTACGAYTDSAGHARSWAVSRDAPELAGALDRWYRPEIRQEIAREEARRMTPQYRIRRHARAPFVSRAKGIISPYDALLKRHAAGIGWDWRLLAAQCYQESAFDPQAVSWAGARGLMQIMPETARLLGLPLSDIEVPDRNIGAAARYLKRLERHFADVRPDHERTWFVLAAYNGGAGHIDDARRLARKAGRNDSRWDEVAEFVLQLSNPAIYRLPEVTYGYMRGSETTNYVQQIRQRWEVYRRHARPEMKKQNKPETGHKADSGTDVSS